MFVRLTFVRFNPGTLDAARSLYMQEIVPIIRKQKGNVNVHLLEPTDPADDFISITEWESGADAESYESSGLYKELVGKFKTHFSSAPVLKTYEAAEALAPA